MRKLKTLLLIFLSIGLCSVTLLGKHQDPKEKKEKKLFVDYREVWVTERTLRHDALATALPAYPEEAVKAGVQGLFDAAVLFDEDGLFKQIKVLDSPHPAITKAVVESLKQWRLVITYDSPYPEHRLPFRTVSELRFHFVIAEGVATVEPATPEEQQKFSTKYAKINSGASDRRTN